MALRRKQTPVRQISRLLKISTNTVRQVIRRPNKDERKKDNPHEQITPVVGELLVRCKGNVVRVQELLQDEHDYGIPYSSLTRLVRETGLRPEKKKVRAGAYEFGPGEEMQHDTSPHRIILGGKKAAAQCAGLVLAYSRKLFIQYYPSFTQFEAKVFLTEAFGFMEGTCPRCVIDNTSVIVAGGSGPDAQIAPEMERFGAIFDVRFRPHAVGDPNRKARIERQFSYIEGNFLAGRSFEDWRDLNARAKDWCMKVANTKFKRSLGMSPEQACVLEKPRLQVLPPYVPPAYQTLHRLCDVDGYVCVDTNRYSVPERLIGKRLEVHKGWDDIQVYFGRRKVAHHRRVIDNRGSKVTAPGHHAPKHQVRTRRQPCPEQEALTGHCDLLDRYVTALKKRSNGRAVRPMRMLLELKRTYPEDAFIKALEEASRYGLYDLIRLEQMILSYVAGDFFCIEDDCD